MSRCIFYFFSLVFFWSCSSPPPPTARQVKPVPPSVEKKKISQYTQQELWDAYLRNPCYLPLIQDSSLWQKGMQAGFVYDELFNDSLSADHPYRHRYLVADFNAVLPSGLAKGAHEIYPTLLDLSEFKGISTDLLQRMENALPGSEEYNKIKTEMTARLGAGSTMVFFNFFDKVWRYRMVPISRPYSIEGSNIYSAGQSIVLCEACQDTLKMVARFATSAKRQDIGFRTGPDEVKRKYYFEYLPTQERRKYYAGLYRITSKNWETARKYDSLDIARDKEVGGGNNRITFYQGAAELPNFLLLQPDPRYPNAMKSNGIHEVALRELARGMLGTANSIGCLRVSDFGSKFLRWWVPQNCKTFVSYQDSLYHKKIKSEQPIEAYLPFKNETEGNAFRKWLNTYQPQAAKILDISEKGDYKNGFIIDGYYYFKDQYSSYLSSQSKR